jgi:hypothetical protein
VTAKLAIEAETFTRLPKVVVAGYFHSGYRHPGGSDLATLDLSFAGRLVHSLPDRAPLRSLSAEQVSEVYRRMRRSRLPAIGEWSIPGLAEAEGEEVFDALDRHYRHGAELAAAEQRGG